MASPTRAPIGQSKVTREPMSEIRSEAPVTTPEIVIRMLPFMALVAVMFLTIGTHLSLSGHVAVFALQIALGVASIATWVRRPH
jgi:hypothetical protein